MRQTFTISAVITMIVSFGQAVGGIICEILAGYYKYPVSSALATSIGTAVTIPLEILCLVLALRYGYIKLEQ